MADIISRLRLDSSEYDNKVRNAAKNLQQFEAECAKGKRSLSDLSAENIKYVQSLGRMETSSRTAKGKIGELSNAFTELSVQYRHLTDQEKQSPYGRALAQSLDQLRQRINESKAELNDVNNTLQSTSKQGEKTGGVMSLLASKFTVNVDAIKLFNIGLQAGSAALGVAKDAFFASEATVDEWGRVVDSSRSLYEGFLTSLNTGDISGFLGRIDQIVSAARNAYNELDRLGTMRTIQAPQISAQQTENDRMRMMLQTGRYIAPIDGRKAAPGMVNGQLLTPQQMRNIEKNLEGGMNKMVSLVGNEVQQTTKVIDAIYERQGAELGMSVKEFRKGTSSMAEFEKRLALYEEYRKFEAAHTTTTTMSTQYGMVSNTHRDNAVNPYAEYSKWGVFRVDGGRYNDLVQLIKQRDQQASQTYTMQSQAYRAINRTEGTTVRGIMGGGSTGGGRTGGTGGGTTTTAPPPTGSIAEQEAKVQALTKAWREATDEVGRAGYAGMLEEAKKILDQMRGGGDIIPEGSLKDLKNQLSELQKARELLSDPVEIAIQDQQIARVQGEIDALNGKVKEAVVSTGSLVDTIRTEIAAAAEKADTNALQNLLRFTIENGINNVHIDTSGILEQIEEGLNIPDEYWENLTDEINANLKEGIKPIKIDVQTGGISTDVTNTGKEVKASWQDAARAISQAGSALNQLEDPSAKIMGIVGQAVANIALGFAQATASDSKLGVFGWIAAIAGGLATMTSTIAAIKSATAGYYAEGGIIPGNRYHDELTANVSSGELILNRAQQNSIAAQLTSNTTTEPQSHPSYVRGEDIYIGVNNYLRSIGKGELITTR